MPLALPLVLLAAPLAAEPSPYVYKPVVGEKSTYASRFTVQAPGQRGELAHKIVMEVLSVEPDGSAHVRFTPSDLKASGIAKGQPFDLQPYEADIDPYGLVKGLEAMSDQSKILAVGLVLPSVAVKEGTWTEHADPLTMGMPGMVIESTVKSRKDDRIVFLSRNRESVQGQNFTRETTFDTKTGKLVAMRMRGKAEGGPQVSMDLDLKEPKR